MNASLSEKLSAVKWGEFRLTDIFVVKNTSNLLASDIIAGSGETPYLSLQMFELMKRQKH